MTTLLTIAEVLAGEALVSPGGPVDRATAVGENPTTLVTSGARGAAADPCADSGFAPRLSR
jgi:hypothetical protein